MTTSPLSGREMEVAILVAEDLSDKTIADILRVSPRTVQRHLDRIGAKLGVKNDRSRRRVISAFIQQRELTPVDDLRKSA